MLGQHTASQTLNSQRSSERQLNHHQPSGPHLLNHKQSSQSGIRASGMLKRHPPGGEHSMAAGGPTAAGSVLSSLSSVNEEEIQMQKLKGEFVEYVKDILTKTTSQSNAATGGNKQKLNKISQMTIIEELTNQLRANNRATAAADNGGIVNKHKQITNINIPELLKQTAKKDQ